MLKGELEGKGRLLYNCKFEKKCDGIVIIFAYYADELYNREDRSDDSEDSYDERRNGRNNAWRP